MTELKFYNTLTRTEESFRPLDPAHVRIYVCGPTVYDRAHIGNARSVVVYDVLVRLLRHLYPQVTYARNITDVDDKINKAARERDIPIGELTAEVTGWFHEDMGALGAEKPDVEPRATAHIHEMIAMIEALIARGHAYAAEGHVLFAIDSDKEYGCLSRRSMDDMVAGARVEVAPYKKHPGDFVLWKPSSDEEPGWDSPWGYGRPGWHIECSAMSTKYLGDTFDIHGGGADLMFPHHENEIAQSTCANDGKFARYWVHNGFLTVNGEKMSKSLGNFITVRDLLDRGVKGEVIRYALMATHYRKPLDWSDKAVEDAQKAVSKLYHAYFSLGLVGWGGVDDTKLSREEILQINEEAKPEEEFLNALKQDLNIPKALSILHSLIKDIFRQNNYKDLYAKKATLKKSANLIGLLFQTKEAYYKGETVNVDGADDFIEVKIAERIAAKKARDFATADRIREELKADGILLEDRPDGTTDWRRA